MIALLYGSACFIRHSCNPEKAQLLGGIVLGGILSMLISSIKTYLHEEKQLKSESKLRSFQTDRSLNSIKRIIEDFRDSNPADKQQTKLLLDKLVDEYSSILDNSNLYEDNLNKLFTIVDDLYNSKEAPDYDYYLSIIDKLIASNKQKMIGRQKKR